MCFIKRLLDLRLRLMRKDKDMFLIFERRILCCVYRPIKENGMWRARFYHELFPVNNEREIIMVVKAERLRLFEQLCRMQEKDPSRTLTLINQKALREYGNHLLGCRVQRKKICS